MTFVVALRVWAPVLTNRQRFNALTVTLNPIFNKTFFVTLTIILALSMTVAAKNWANLSE